MIDFLRKRPSAWLPLALSLAAFALVAGHIGIHGKVREADEGAAAHIFQLLMAGQAGVVLFFLVKWVPKAPGPALRVLALQVCAALVALAPVYWLEH
jgi:hypothetical protein